MLKGYWRHRGSFRGKKRRRHAAQATAAEAADFFLPETFRQPLCYLDEHDACFRARRQGFGRDWAAFRRQVEKQGVLTGAYCALFEKRLAHLCYLYSAGAILAGMQEVVAFGVEGVALAPFADDEGGRAALHDAILWKAGSLDREALACWPVAEADFCAVLTPQARKAYQGLKKVLTSCFRSWLPVCFIAGFEVLLADQQHPVGAALVDQVERIYRLLGLAREADRHWEF
ncbi:hypothetical protein [Bittarella massiliensis (ex Durand et al. 2017)]|uniref:Uncharacterized protein n=1 Tax=Bittarella massiliensis (ex Durand et al. 2017) TaxID=1720313 RepID=A0ABW9WRN9_9FIRM|nr:hypothetical protein [Bittarella massiliensis (ex Durand et al. 2017)]MZL68509.1 hypothetical protein [Bittarella massiliensis (ex Durand et al. 2017)]MZL79436.1 hypothetical protein [Bittarella massiliensis (ex Durand et al. 2017)]